MSTTAASRFDLLALSDAIERDDADGQAELYAPDAIVEIVDRDHPPASPTVIRGREAIRAALADVTSRELTHSVESAVTDGSRAAVLVRCRYPGGAVVVCSTTLELDGGLIAREVRVQAWDA